MMSRLELVVGPLRALRRSIFWWAAGLASLIAGTVAFWPVFKGSSAITDALDQLPSGILGALGLANFGTPAGYLRGNLYELFLPLLLAIAAVAFVNGQTAGEEASGRLELLLAQPVARWAVYLGRAVAALVGLGVVLVALAVVQFGVDVVVDLQMDSGHLLSTILLCALLAVFHGSVAFVVAGFRARPSRVLAIGVGLALAGYLVAALFPLSSLLEPWRHISPWDWAFGGDPLEHATDAWRYVALSIPAVLLTAVGLVAVAKRDVVAG
jgi:ABC-2 type transport system permease protein